MNICLAGWYFHEPLLKMLGESRHKVSLICHRGWPKDKGPWGINFDIIPNVGLEFGCYDWYLKDAWKDGGVLFMHDDNEITVGALNLIDGLDRDQVFLFSSEEEAAANGRAHGRAMWCSERFLRRLKADGGFWYDEGNTGDVSPTTADGPNYHNAGILTFQAYLMTVARDLTVGRFAAVPGLKCGYRGRI